MTSYEGRPPDWWQAHPAELADALDSSTSSGGAGFAGEQRLTLTVEEAADALGISRSLAYDAVRAGQIPHIKIGRRILVPRQQLDQLLRPSG